MVILFKILFSSQKYSSLFLGGKLLFLYNQAMKRILKLLTIMLLVALVTTCATTSGLGSVGGKVPLTRDALTGVLPNGLRYYILENSLPENRAHLALIVNAGSVLERDDQRGFAHFIEHLAFNDTARFPKLELIEYLRSLGMRFGADANAYTSYDETVYHFDVPVENSNGVKKIPDRALAILDDWTYAVSLNSDDVKSESRVVLEEMRSRLGAMERVRKITLPILFAGSAYADRDVIGLPEIIENATSEQLMEFYKRWYTSDNMALVFAGDFDGKALEAQLASHFNMPKASKPVNRPHYELPPPKNGNFNIEIITDPELTSANFMIYYKQKKGALKGTVAYYRETLIDYLIDTMLTFRFEEAQGNPESAANDSWGGVWRWSKNSRFYSMGTVPKTGRIEEALKELLLEMEAMRRYGFTESELSRAKISLASYMEKLLSEKDRMESRTFIRGFTNHFLYGEDMSDIEWEVDAVNKMLPGIGLKEIAKVSAAYFSANDINIFLIAPQGEIENLPAKESIKNIFIQARNTKITPRKDITISSDLMDSIPQAGTFSSDIIDKDTGANIITLSNGAKIILKETSNKNNEIILYAIANGGSVNAKEEEIVSVNLLSEMTAVSGLGQYSRMELMKKLTGKQTGFSFWLSNYYRGFQGTSTTKDINALFEMIHIFFTMPRLEERAISAMIDQYKTSLKNQDDDPQRAFSREISRVISNNHPLFKPLELDDMNKVSIKQAQGFLDKCLNPADYTFIFTGNFDSKEIKKLSEIYIASIEQNNSFNKWIDPGIKRPGESRKTIYKGKDKRCIVYLAWFSPSASVFNEQRNQISAVLSEYLDIILTDEIREKLGGVYSISAGTSVSVIPRGETRLSSYFVCDPERAEELIKTVKESISNVYNKPVNIDTFNKAKEALLMEHEKALQSNLHIAQSYANSFVLYNTPLSRLNLRPNAIRAVTAKDMQDFCRQVHASGAIELMLLPEKTP